MKTKNGSQIHQVLSGRNKVYLIHSQDDWILVDTGLSSYYPKLKQRLQKTLPANTRLTLFLTHAHYDHTQNAKALKDDFNCRIIVSKQEDAFLKTGRTPLPQGTNFFAKWLVFLGETIGKSKTGFPPFESDEVVKDDMVFSSSLKIIQTPGHTVGSQSLIVDDEMAFVGDAMLEVFKNTIYPPFADDVKEMIQSWGKLLESNCRFFFPGHGRKVDRELLENEYHKHSRKMLL